MYFSFYFFLFNQILTLDLAAGFAGGRDSSLFFLLDIFGGSSFADGSGP